MYRFSDRTKKVKELLESGIIGDVKYINSSIRILLDNSGNIRYDPDRGEGSLYDLGCYAVNFVGMVMGCTPVGTKGVIEISNTFSGIAKVINVITEQGNRKIEVKETNNFVLEVEDFADAVINDRQPMLDLDETLRNIKIIEQLREMVYRK